MKVAQLYLTLCNPVVTLSHYLRILHLPLSVCTTSGLLASRTSHGLVSLRVQFSVSLRVQPDKGEGSPRGGALGEKSGRIEDWAGWPGSRGAAHGSAPPRTGGKPAWRTPWRWGVGPDPGQTWEGEKVALNS